jgi:hypothetical protein
VLGMVLSFVDTILLNLSLASSKIKYYEPEKKKIRFNVKEGLSK